MGSKRRQRRGQIDVESMRNIRCEYGREFCSRYNQYRQAQVERDSELFHEKNGANDRGCCWSHAEWRNQERHVEDLMRMSTGGSWMSIALMT